jgi:imidazolonepropionase-like amidohydrolase
MRTSWSLACLLLLFSPSAVAAAVPTPSSPETLRYKIISNGSVAGRQVDTYSADGHVESVFEYNDRGRGPKIRATYVFGPDSVPTRADVTGVDYLKAPVDEHFFVEDGIARWRSSSEKADKPAGAFYLTNNGSFGPELAQLVAALSKTKDHSIKLFPAGEARLERLEDTTLENHGQKMHLTEFAITGLDFTPVVVWLDDDGRFFANPNKWFAWLREGWEDSNQTLYDLQLKAENARSRGLAHELAKHPAHPVAFEHVRIFDSEQALMREDQTVVVDGERIASIGDANSLKVPADAEHIDGRGKTLLPGLFDMHVHVQATDGILHVASGVTSVRDMANDIDEIRRIQEQWDSGAAIGPHLWKAGIIDGRGLYQVPTGLYADTVDEALAAVNRYVDLGYIQIKLYSSLPPTFVAPVAKLAHQRGVRVSGHVPNGMIASQFVEAGADEIQHINFIMLNFMADKVKDTRTPERFTAVGQYSAKLDLDSKPVKDFIQLLRDHGTTVDVTVATFEGMFLGRPGQVSPDMAPVLDRLPAQVQRGAYHGGLAVTPETDQFYKDSYMAMLRMTKKMYDAGIPILAGTDATPGIMLHRELELEVKLGIPANKALQIATLNAARLLKQDRDVGSITPGKRADLVLVEGNPVENIGDIRRCRQVMKNGTLYDSAALYRAVGVGPAK